MTNNRGLWRGKRVDNGEWVEGFPVKMWGAVHLQNNENENLMVQVIPETLGECTGKPDIKGKPIFEGDIVRAYKFGEEEFVNSISFRNGCFWFGSWNFVEFLDRFRDYDVIGNIYDNPELLSAT